jgi:hypothetical protein
VERAVSAIFWKLFYFVFVCFCVLIVSHDFFERLQPHKSMSNSEELVVAVIIGVLLIAPDAIRATKHERNKTRRIQT